MKKYNIKTQAQVIVHFIEQMDIEMIDAFLSEQNTYQNMSKYLFLSKLQKVFKFFSGFRGYLLSALCRKMQHLL